uniref:Uncharacterized protein n=1 Tax=Rhizophora mucronata TaxID=61149 RepID=A0A2P2PY51_RHIMU
MWLTNLTASNTNHLQASGQFVFMID